MGLVPDETARRPTPGIDYPRTQVEFHEFFRDEAACLTYLERLRWPEGFQCPACRSGEEAKRWTRGRLVCRGCGHEASVTAGTIFEGTRKPLRHWFLAAWDVTSQKYGASALGLQRVLGLRSYETAWAWLHKLRRAMVRPDRDRLKGREEIDETYVGGEEAGVRGRETERKSIVVIAVELKRRKTARVRLRVVRDVSAETLTPVVQEVVESGSTVLTDAWGGYAWLYKVGFKHQVEVLSESPDPAHVVMPHVHRVASLLKRWWLGTHQGAISREHLAYYLDEFTFRFNRRGSGARGLLFYRLLSQAVQTGHTGTDALFLGVRAARDAARRRGRRPGSR